MPNDRQDDRTTPRDERIEREKPHGRQRTRGTDPATPARDSTRDRAGMSDRPETDADNGAPGARQVRPPEGDEDFNIPGELRPEE